MKRWLRAMAVAAAAAIAGPCLAADDDYPARPVRIVVPFAPGGSTDVVARVLADKLAVELKQSFVVDNRAGAGGNIGADAVAKSAPDGYTLLMATTGVLAINQHLYRGMSYDPDRDFTPVSFATLGVEPVGGPPEAFAQHVRTESEKWGKVVRAANIAVN